MIRALRNARHWPTALTSGSPLKRLASEGARSERHVARVVKLSGLSPKIHAAIIDGTQPVEQALKRLQAMTRPLDWVAQERALGFGV